MKKIILSISLILSCAFPGFAKSVLIIADEWPQMEILAEYLKTEGKFKVQSVEQTGIPKRISSNRAVFMFIHKDLNQDAALQMIDYAKNGGKLIVMHHGISSAKRKVPQWFDLLGVHLPTKEEEPDNYYTYQHEVDYHIVNLRPSHYITTNKILWPDTIEYQSSDAPSRYAQTPAMIFENSEIFMNHNFKDGREKTVLLGFHHKNPKTGKIIMQDRGGWYKKAGKGWVFYFQPGHLTSDFQQPYCQMLLNCLNWKPGK